MAPTQPSCLRLGLAYGAGALAVVLPLAILFAHTGARPDPGEGSDLSPLEAAGLALFGVTSGSLLFTVTLMRLRGFAWRQFRHGPGRIAAAIGVAAAALSVGTVFFDDSGAAGPGTFAAAALLSALVFRRVS